MIKRSSGSSPQEKRLLRKEANIIAELNLLKAMSDEEVDTSDIAEKLDWSNAEIGKFYRPVKKLVSMRVDADVLDWFQSRGKQYTALMNQALRSYVAAQEAVATKPKPTHDHKRKVLK